MRNAYVWGFNSILDRLMKPLEAHHICIVGIVANEIQYKEIIGIPVISSVEMVIDGVDYIIVCDDWDKSLRFLRDICGIDENKIIKCDVFFLPYFDLDGYIRLRKSKVSIFANNCIAGSIYNQLGLSITSPTINMICRSGKEYIDFLKNYETYLNIDMKIHIDRMNNECDDMSSTKNYHYPQGIIDDKVVWLFPHNKYANEGVSAWNRRKERVNRENIAVIMAIVDDEDERAFSNLSFKKKIGFYFKNHKLKDVLYISEWGDNELRQNLNYSFSKFTVVMNRENNIIPFPIRIDWIKFLNGEGNYIRY